MPVGEFAVGKALRIACAALISGWLLLWLFVAVLGSTADSVLLRPCSARAVFSFGGHRRTLHNGCGHLAVYALDMLSVMSTVQRMCLLPAFAASN